MSIEILGATEFLGASPGNWRREDEWKRWCGVFGRVRRRYRRQVKVRCGVDIFGVGGEWLILIENHN